MRYMLPVGNHLVSCFKHVIMNRLQLKLQQLQQLPAFLRPWARTKAIGSAIPFVGTAGIEVLELTPQRTVFRIGNRRKVQNHIHQVHAGATALLAETATGLALGMNIPDERLPLIKQFTVEYVRRSQGAITAEATFPAGVDFNQPKGEVEIPVRITDETGTEVVQGRYLWAWITKEKR